MSFHEQILTIADNLANTHDEEASETFQSNLKFLLEIADSTNGPIALDLAGPIQTIASNLANTRDDEISATYQANLKFLLKVASSHPDNEQLSDLLSTTAAAERLGMSRPTLMKLIEAGEMEHVMIGSHHRIPEEAVRRYVRLNRVSRDLLPTEHPMGDEADVPPWATPLPGER